MKNEDDFNCLIVGLIAGVVVGFLLTMLVITLGKPYKTGHQALSLIEECEKGLSIRTNCYIVAKPHEDFKAYAKRMNEQNDEISIENRLSEIEAKLGVYDTIIQLRIIKESK